MQLRLLTVTLLVVLAGCQAVTPNSVSQPPIATAAVDLSNTSPNETTPDGIALQNPAAETQELPAVITAEEAQANQDLWARIRKGLTLNVPENEQIITQRDWYERNQEYMDRTAERATRYLHHIVETLQARNLPMDLALLPVVESAFQPYAYSSSRAAGIWQFISGTGKNFGLKQTWWQDGRRDVVRSTDAALDYLTRLNQQFDGDWLLALAAYNSGEGNVARAIERNKRKGLPTDFWSLDLPKETRAYVPKLLALVQLVREPEHFALHWQTIPNSPYFTRVRVDSQIDMSLAAQLAGISEDELYLLNPAYTRWATSPDSSVELLLPITAAERFEAELAKLPPQERIKWLHYSVKKGDTLSKVAREFRTSPEQIKSSNKLTSNNLKPGTELLIPRGANQSGAAPDSMMAPMTAREKADLVAASNGGKTPGFYKVKSSETLWSISRKYHVDVHQLIALNKLSGHTDLQMGQTLIMPISAKSQSQSTPGKVVANSDKPSTKAVEAAPQDKPASAKIMAGAPVSRASATPQKAKTSAHSEDSESHTRYTVQSGDSFFGIAQKFGVTVDALKRWNNVSKKNNDLRPGQRLKIMRNGGLANGA